MDPFSVFSSRVQNYVRYRPGYPMALLDLLRAECHLGTQAVVADIGSGTGLLSAVFLKGGHTVFSVEPNAAMRRAAEELLKGYPRFHSVDGQAEATRLPDGSVDLVAAGQALHWFEPESARAEFRRILRPPGWVAAVYNVVRVDSPFMEAFKQFLWTYLGEKDSAEGEDDLFARFFEESGYVEKQIEGLRQSFDLEGLAGRVLSKAVAPEPGHPRHAEMMAALEGLFRRHQRRGKVTFVYDTQAAYGKVGED